MHCRPKCPHTHGHTTPGAPTHARIRRFAGFEDNLGNGEVEYEEFEAWFLAMELRRAKDTAKAADAIRTARVDIRGLMQGFGGMTELASKKLGKVKRTVEPIRISIAEKFNYNAVVRTNKRFKGESACGGCRCAASHVPKANTETKHCYQPFCLFVPNHSPGQSVRSI